VRFFFWLLGALQLILFASQLPWARVAIGQNDFLQLYGGAQLVGAGLLHDPTAMEQVHRSATGAYLPAVQYVRPDYYAVLLQPLAHLPYRAAYALFQLFNLLALIAIWRLLSPGTPGRWLASLSIPLLVCFVNGRDVALFLLCVIAAFHFAPHRPLLSGALLALATIKPHFLVFLPFTLLFFARWRIPAAALANPHSWLQRGLLALSLPLAYWLLMFDAPLGALPALTLAATLTADILLSVNFSPSSLFRSTPPRPAR
jgi:hypothetical protein